MNSKDIGDISVSAVIFRLSKAGKHILVPVGDNRRYDIVIDEHGKFFRVQIKTGRLRDGVIRFKTCSSSYHRNGGGKPYIGEIDYFAVYCPQNDGVYLVPISDMKTVSEGSLRVGPPKNNQIKKIRTASDYKV